MSRCFRRKMWLKVLTIVLVVGLNLGILDGFTSSFGLSESIAQNYTGLLETGEARTIELGEESFDPPTDETKYAIWKQGLAKESGSFIGIMGFSNNRMYNEYIEYAVLNDGTYTVGTTGGNPDNPNDDYKKMLYGHPSPWSSYTTIRLNGSNHYFTPNTQLPTHNEAELSTVSEQTIGDISVKQVCKIVENTATGRNDVVEIKYIVKNEGTTSANAGVRIMLDTMLGSNDHAPFRVPGVGALTKELELSGDNIPEYWQAFDSLTNPMVISQGTLLRGIENKPDKVQFTNWFGVYDTPWGYTVSPGYDNGDSAVSIIWNEDTLLPGKTKEYVTYYGLSELQQDLRPPLAVSVTGASNIQIINGKYSPNPFTVTAYIMNNGSADAANVYARINLPEGLKLATNETTTTALGSVNVSQEKQVSWSVVVEPSHVDRTLEYSIDVWADEVENKNVQKGIIIPRTLYLKKSGNFKYTSTASNDRDYMSRYYYDDEYFLNSSYIYNESLATMSLCFAMAAGASNEKTYTYKSDNAKDLLTQTGFSQFDTNYWFTVKPTADSIGVVAANKKISMDNKTYTLIAVGVRGFGYEQEWASNFTIGKTGQHQGFNQAKNNVLNFIKSYISENNISGDIKLWITGYSRAGGTANLVAGAIDGGETLGNCTLKLSDLYAYTFEAPRGAIAANAATKSIYKNIFNIVNPSDPVPKVAPAEFGFSRYGVDKELPTKATDRNYKYNKENMLRIYDPMESTVEPYSVDNFIMKKVTVAFGYIPSIGVTVTPTIANDTKNKDSQDAFLDTFITKLAKEQFKSRTNYVDKFQAGIREVFKVLEGTTDNITGKQDVKWAKFKKIFEDKLTSNIGTLIVSTIPAGSKIVGSTPELVEEYAVESLNEAGITSFNRDQIHNLALTFSETIISFAVNHPNLTATMFYNRKGIGSAHYPELCLAWMQSMDKNYTTNAGQAFSSGSYRIIRINCPVDVEVYDDSSILVAEIKSDEPQTIGGSSIISSINEDGEKLIYLPATAEYNLKLIPTGSGNMTYSINEYNSEVGEVNRVVNYYDLSIKSGDIFTSRVPAYSNDDIANGTPNGSTTVYTLFDCNSELIVVSDDLKGSDATEAYYMVNVTSNNDEYGYVTGQGIRQLGNYAQITAIPFNDCEFDGWYVQDQKVSSNPQYRFRVQSDVEVVGRFTKNLPPDVSNAVASVPVIWSPNNKMTETEIQNVTDPDGDPVTITITSITQDEPLKDTKKGDGSGIGSSSAWVRASRDGKGNGRVYKISFTANDGRGGESSGFVLVKVAHDQGKDNIIDDGQNYNSVIK